MIVFQKSRQVFGALAVCAALVLPACSSSSSGGSQEVTTQQIADKLKNDPKVTALKSQLGSQADKFSVLVDCVAKSMKKDVKQSELRSYVNGDKKINELSVPDTKITSDITTCAKSEISGS